MISPHAAYPRSCRVGLLMALRLSGHKKLNKVGRGGLFLRVNSHLLPCGHPDCTAVLLLLDVI